jgi:hypothetical protein
LPLIEQSERICGAVFLSVTAFDSFVWLLDNCGRTELLVKLHSNLPPLMLNPTIQFVCLCFGLSLLYSSDKRQLQRVVNSVSTRRRVLDSSRIEIIIVEKPKWLLPVVLSFVFALIITPLLALGYSLSYKGISPGPVNPPRPPAIAYLETPKPAHKSLTFPPPQTGPGGISIGRDNNGRAIVNNTLPPPKLTFSNETETENQDGTYTTTYLFQVDAEVAPVHLILQVTAEGLLKVNLLSHVEGNQDGSGIALYDVKSGEGFYSATLHGPSGRYDLAVTRSGKSKINVASIFK